MGGEGAAENGFIKDFSVCSDTGMGASEGGNLKERGLSLYSLNRGGEKGKEERRERRL